MFHFYMKFILDNLEKPTNLKEIIITNENLLYKLNNKKRKKLHGGTDTNEDIEKINIQNSSVEQLIPLIEKFRGSTINIITGLDSAIVIKKEEFEKINKAFVELLKYIDLLAKTIKEEDLKKIKQQLTELQFLLSASQN